MTARVSDKFIFNNKEYHIYAESENIIKTSFENYNYNYTVGNNKFGFGRRIHYATCFGHLNCNYVVLHNKLTLNNLNVMGSEKYPEINNCTPEINSYGAKYSNIDLICDFTGTIVIVRDPIKEWAGSGNPLTFKDVVELEFNLGNLVGYNLFAEKFNELREIMPQYCKNNDVEIITNLFKTKQIKQHIAVWPDR